MFIQREPFSISGVGYRYIDLEQHSPVPQCKLPQNLYFHQVYLVCIEQ